MRGGERVRSRNAAAGTLSRMPLSAGVDERVVELRATRGARVLHELCAAGVLLHATHAARLPIGGDWRKTPAFTLTLEAEPARGERSGQHWASRLSHAPIVCTTF